MTSTRILVGITALLAPLAIQAEVKMPAIFGDHMVLQQDRKIPIWGWADPGEKVVVSFAGQSAQTIAGTDGKWRVDLAPVPANAAPGTLIITGQNRLTFSDVLVGDVWLASGQSNMDFGIQMTHTAKVELPKADHPQIRLFYVAHVTSALPLEDLPPVPEGQELQSKWQICTPEMLAKDGYWGGFSAVAYFFARDIQQFTNHPLGIISSQWGGTPAQAWTSLVGLEKEPPFQAYVQQSQHNLETYQKLIGGYASLLADYKAAKKTWDAEVKPSFDAAMKDWSAAAKTAQAFHQTSPPRPQPSRPAPPIPQNPNPGPQQSTALYNSMIAPLMPYAIKGVIWYQGESNTPKAGEYRTLFPRMIADWREHWGQGDFPFLFVQLAGFAGARPEEDYPLLRDSQLQSLSVPNTGMAVAIDLGAEKNVHPTDKLDVGARLALAARHIAYGDNNVYSGPIYDSLRIQGHQAVISFKNTGSGLVLGVSPWKANDAPVPATELTGFTIAGADQHWVEAKARIEGNTVVVSSDQVAAPVAIRYAWAGDPVCNLYNREGLPASPFRTDSTSTSQENLPAASSHLDSAPATTKPVPSFIQPAVAWYKECVDRIATMKGKPCDVIFIGDSITQNFCELPRSGWNLVGRAVWDKYYANKNVLNFGVGGDSTQNVLWRMDHMDIKDFRPKVVVVLLGMNNQKDTPEDIASGVQAVIDKARSFYPGVKIIAVSVTANGRMPEKTPKINELIRSLADNRTVFYFDLNSLMTPVGVGWKGVGGDKVHLTQEGYELWASGMEPLLNKLLGL